MESVYLAIPLFPLVGAIIGGVIGNQFGSGSGRDAATAAAGGAPKSPSALTQAPSSMWMNSSVGRHMTWRR